MNISLSETRLIEGDVVVWQEPGHDVDVTMDLKNLTFRPGSVDRLCAFHVLDHMFEKEVIQAISNWRQALKPGASLFIVVDDFEYVARALVGGDIDMSVFNREHAHPMQFSKDSLVDLLIAAGFKDGVMKVWYVDVPNLFPRKHYELVIEVPNV